MHPRKKNIITRTRTTYILHTHCLSYVRMESAGIIIASLPFWLLTRETG